MRIGHIRRRSDFVRIAEKKRKWVSLGLILQVDQTLKEDLLEGTPLRVGYTASKKIGGAVKRNRAKRRLRAAVAHVMPFSAKNGNDYVVIARKATLTRRFEDLQADLKKALEKTEAAKIMQTKK